MNTEIRMKSFGRLEYFIQGLIVLNLIAVAIRTLPHLSEETKQGLWIFEIVSVAIFTVEYILRFFLSKPSWRYACSFFGIVDLLAILPFYFGLAFDFRSVRIFRLLRLLRLIKLARYNATVDRFQRAFAIAKDELVLFGIITAMLLYLAAVGIYHFEHPVQPEVFSSIFQSLWWAVVTLTTVGYGDAYPITGGGKAFTSVILFLGLGIVAVPTGIFATALAKAREEEKQNSE